MDRLKYSDIKRAAIDFCCEEGILYFVYKIVRPRTGTLRTQAHSPTEFLIEKHLIDSAPRNGTLSFVTWFADNAWWGFSDKDPTYCMTGSERFNMAKKMQRVLSVLIGPKSEMGFPKPTFDDGLDIDGIFIKHTGRWAVDGLLRHHMIKISTQALWFHSEDLRCKDLDGRLMEPTGNGVPTSQDATTPFISLMIQDLNKENGFIGERT
ncbi:hypothetical protein CEK25_011199 [Fusarium fujikuroi]|nr:hypothetical protein CEK25_011199 [Fusarium fujikuroi]